jgi:hypothetical protein
MKYLVTIREGRRYIVEAEDHETAMERAVESHREGYSTEHAERLPNATMDYGIERYSEGTQP